METFKIGLTRSYIVTIKAENLDKAKRYSEYYLGDFSDLSDEKERTKKNFDIEDIEMVYNESHEI